MQLYKKVPTIKPALVLLNQFSQLVGSTELYKMIDVDTIPESAKIIYTNKIPKTPISKLPILISSAGMMFGGDRQIWVQTAEKVVYFTNDVYNKNKEKGRNVCKLN